MTGTTLEGTLNAITLDAVPMELLLYNVSAVTVHSMDVAAGQEAIQLVGI